MRRRDGRGGRRTNRCTRRGARRRSSHDCLACARCLPARSSRRPPRSTSTRSATNWTSRRGTRPTPSPRPQSVAADAPTTARPEAIPFVTRRSGRLDGPGPGGASGAGRRRLSGAATRSPTSLLRARRAERWRRRPGAAGRRCTARTATPRCIRSSCPRARPACCRATQRPAVLWTIRLDARGEPIEVDVRRTVDHLGRATGLPGRAGRRRRRHPASVDRAAAGDRRAAAATRPGAARDQPGHPGFGDRPTGRTGTGRWSCGPCCRSSSTTPRSAC